MCFKSLLVFASFGVPDFDGLVGGFPNVNNRRPISSPTRTREGEKHTAAREPFPIRTEFNGRDTEFVAFECVLDPVVWPSGARGRFCSRALFGLYERSIGGGHMENARIVKRELLAMCDFSNEGDSRGGAFAA